MSYAEGEPALSEFNSMVTNVEALVAELRMRARQIEQQLRGAPLLDIHANFTLGKAAAYHEIANTLSRMNKP